jgi:putative FmdB family regulatory protein
MPIYAYRCLSCGHAKDVLQKLSDPLLTVCPACGEPQFTKQVTAAGFQLKGSGWYVTDFKPGANAGKKAEGDAPGKSGDAEGGKAGSTGDAGKAGEGSGKAAAEGKASGKDRQSDGDKSSSKTEKASEPKAPAPAASGAAKPGSGGKTPPPTTN